MYLDVLTTEQLLSLPRSVIIALEHKTKPWVYLSLAHNVFSFIDRLNASNRKSCNFRIKIYESINNRNILLQHLAQQENSYTDRGYTLVTRETMLEDLENPITSVRRGLYYKVVVRIGLHDRLYVLLVNKRNEKVIAGVFTRQDDANSFVDEFYPETRRGARSTVAVISVSYLTREYYKKELAKRLGLG